MTDAINTFDASTQDAAAFGLEQPIKGDGYALTHDPVANKWRADVWENDGAWRCCPLSGAMTDQRALLMSNKLVSDFDALPDWRQQKALRMSGNDVSLAGNIRERSEPGYSRAVALRDAMLAMYA